MDQQVGLPFPIAQKVASGNKKRIFTKIRNDGQSGAERIRTDGFPDIMVNPKFKLPKDRRYFASGSCFARNVEAALSGMGVDVITSKCLIAGEFYDLPGASQKWRVERLHAPVNAAAYHLGGTRGSG